ncbi:MAG: VOC family protein [Pseudomonadota bacterium]
MRQTIARVSLVVHDYDDAIAFYTQKLGFDLLEDEPMPAQNKRWVVVAPRGDASTSLVLARASNDEQRAAVGRQTGGRVGFFLSTDDFWRDHRAFTANGVEFVRGPFEESYGTVAVFKDLYGNLWDLVGPAKGS